MTWIAQLRDGPLDGETMRVTSQEGAFAVPLGEFAAGLAVYTLYRTSEGCVLMPKAGQLVYRFSCVRDYTLAECALWRHVAVTVLEAVA